jgi:iron complex transport system permease protein
MSEMVLWLLGSVRDRSLGDVGLAVPFVAAGAVLLVASGQALDALALGEDTAQSLGISLKATRRRVIFGTALAVGTAVAVSGTIGFVGLVVPHVIRPLVGHAPGRALLPSAVAGACLLLAADIVVRLLPTAAELMLGVVTALIGAPFFLYLIVKTRRSLL